MVARKDGERVVNAADYFIGPGTDITRLTVLRPGELLTTIRIPGAWAGARVSFEKARDRQVWDFALVNVASAMRMNGNRIGEARLVVGRWRAALARWSAAGDDVGGRATLDGPGGMLRHHERRGHPAMPGVCVPPARSCRAATRRGQRRGSMTGNTASKASRNENSLVSWVVSPPTVNACDCRALARVR